VDGPAFLHDRFRKTRSGRGTSQKVSEGMRLLREHGIDFHVITVLTADSLSFADEIFDFFLEHGVRNAAFNVEEIEGPHTTSTLSGDEAQARYREFLGRFFELITQSGEPFSLREFDSAWAALARPAGAWEGRPQQTTPFAIVTIDHAGNFSTFSPELAGLPHADYGNFVYGNVLHDSFAAGRETALFRRVEREIAAGVERCRAECDYFAWCGGGAPVNKLFENGSFDSTETMFCRLTRQAPIDLLVRKTEQLGRLGAPSTGLFAPGEVEPPRDREASWDFRPDLPSAFGSQELPAGLRGLEIPMHLWRRWQQLLASVAGPSPSGGDKFQAAYAEMVRATVDFLRYKRLPLTTAGRWDLIAWAQANQGPASGAGAPATAASRHLVINLGVAPANFEFRDGQETLRGNPARLFQLPVRLGVLGDGIEPKLVEPQVEGVVLLRFIEVSDSSVATQVHCPRGSPAEAPFIVPDTVIRSTTPPGAAGA
jgi:hypothetical protein